jgi:glycosyltransferase involved in cell wall biosynthesis
LKFIIVGNSPYSFVKNGIPINGCLHGHAVAFTRQFLPFLISQGHKVCLILPDRTPLHDSNFDVKNDPIPNGLTLIPFMTFQSPYIPSFLTFLAALEEGNNHMEGIDFVLSVYPYPYSVLIQLARHNYGYKTAAFLRGGDGYAFINPEFLNSHFGLDKQEMNSLVYRRSLNEMDFVFTTSDWLRKEVIYSGVKVDDVIPAPAIENDNLQSSSNEDQSKIKCVDLFRPLIKFGTIDPQKKWLLSASRFSSDKHLDLAIEAFSKANLKNWQLIITGIGPLENELIKLVQEFRLSSNVVILFSPPRLVAHLFANTDAFLHVAIPTEKFIDSRPSSVTTASYYGKPVIFPLAEKGGVSESISPDNISHLGFAPGNCRNETIENITAKIMMLNRNLLMNRIGESNRIFAQKFNKVLIFTKIVNLLSSLNK